MASKRIGRFDDNFPMTVVRLHRLPLSRTNDKVCSGGLGNSGSWSDKLLQHLRRINSCPIGRLLWDFKEETSLNKSMPIELEQEMIIWCARFTSMSKTDLDAGFAEKYVNSGEIKTQGTKRA